MITSASLKVISGVSFIFSQSGIDMLNLENAHREIKDFEKAYFTFLRGLKGFKRLDINTGKELD